MTAVVGRSPDQLSIAERAELEGQWMALEIYSPATLPLRTIAAIGATAAECARQLQALGKDPTRYEYAPIRRAFA